LVFKLEKWRPVNPNGGSSLKFYVFGIIELRRGKDKIAEYTRHYAPKIHTTAPATGFFFTELHSRQKTTTTATKTH
jgi:hypothetical protein